MRFFSSTRCRFTWIPDRKTFQIDAEKIEAAITPQTKCILPVHLGGNPVNLDRILSIASKHGLRVVEDACQAHLAEWRGKKVGTHGDLGCFSFQASKNLNCGEGGAILGNDEVLMQRCEIFHNNGHGMTEAYTKDTVNGSNHRLTEFQGALLGAQITRVQAQAEFAPRMPTTLLKCCGRFPAFIRRKNTQGLRETPITFICSVMIGGNLLDWIVPSSFALSMRKACPVRAATPRSIRNLS